MRQTKAAFSEILNEHKSRPLISVTIYLTVTVCFLAAFISMRVLQKDAVIFEDQYSARCTYKDIILDTVQYGSAAELAASLTKLNDIGASVKGVGFSSVDDPLTFELEGLGRMSAGMKVIPDSEYAYPDGSIVCPDIAAYDGKSISVGDTITYFGQSFTVADIRSEGQLSLSELASLDVKDYSVSIESIVFYEPPDVKTLDRLSSLLKTHEDIQSEYELAADSNQKIYADQLLITILICVLSALIIVTLFKALMRMLLPRIAMLRIFGCRNGFVVFFFLLTLVWYIILSFTVAVFIDSLCNGVYSRFTLENAVPFGMQSMALLFTLIVSLIFTLPACIRAARCAPARLGIRR